MDRARIQTNKELNKIDRKIGRIYQSDPALKNIQKEYDKYMKMVQEKTQSSYDAYINEIDREIREDLKKVYMNEVRSLTIESKQYRKLIQKFAKVMSDVNEEALKVVNDSITDVYTLNYNQVAVDCKEVGIEVNG
jgi:hypothetical protein